MQPQYLFGVLIYINYLFAYLFTYLFIFICYLFVFSFYLFILCFGIKSKSVAFMSSFSFTDCGMYWYVALIYLLCIFYSIFWTAGWWGSDSTIRPSIRVWVWWLLHQQVVLCQSNGLLDPLQQIWQTQGMFMSTLLCVSLSIQLLDLQIWEISTSQILMAYLPQPDLQFWQHCNQWGLSDV